MPAPFRDSAYIDRALRAEALPALERLAQNPFLRDRTLRRFDRDEPPPYISSTEESEDDMPCLAVNPTGNALSDESIRLLEAPLDHSDRDNVALDLQQIHAYEPGRRFAIEAEGERERIESWAWREASEETRNFFAQVGIPSKCRAGQERVNIIARRNIKRRWKKLGVWNPEWGIPGNMNNTRPNDDDSKWKWPWQRGNETASWRNGPEAMALNPQHPITRALRLREGLHRSQHIPVTPRPRLQDDAPASQGESFIVSRPWFTYLVESWEEVRRYDRIHWKQKRFYKSTAAYVRGRWKENGAWKADWGAVGWKWPHESPSPEPEELDGLEDLTTFELTPSEADALEAVRPPTPPTPHPIRTSPDEPGVPRFGSVPLCLADRFGTAAQQPSLQPQQSSPPPQQPSAPQQPRRQPRRQQEDANSGRPVRRSARIAALAAKQSLPHPPPQQEQRQQRRRANQPTPANPPTAKKPKQGRGRKRSELVGVSKPPTRARGRQRKK